MKREEKRGEKKEERKKRKEKRGEKEEKRKKRNSFFRPRGTPLFGRSFENKNIFRPKRGVPLGRAWVRLGALG